MNFYQNLHKMGWRLYPIGLLACLFLYQFVGNIFLASWEVIALRNVDDYAIQMSIHNMQKAIVHGKFHQVLTTFDYAYGNAFWLLNSILLLPFYLLKSEQLLIILGRQISLIFIFASIYLINLIIERIRPKEDPAKYAILIFVATLPIVATITMKYHVNAQAIFLGLLSFYLLISDEVLNRKKLIWSAVFLGMSVGFKLTSILILPTIGLVLLSRLRQQEENLIKNLAIYGFIALLVAIFCTSPLCLLFHVTVAQNLYNTLILFKDLNHITNETRSTLGVIHSSISPLLMCIGTFLITSLSFLALAIKDLKNKRYTSSAIFFPSLTLIILVSLLLNKPQIWVDTYLLQIIILWPIGLLGLTTFNFSPKIKNTVIYAILIIELSCGYGIRRLTFGTSYNIKNDPIVISQLSALQEMRSVISIAGPAKILQDPNVSFPYTAIDDNIEITFNYGDLRTMGKNNKFDFIAINSAAFYPFNPKDNPVPTFKKQKSLAGLQGVELEVAIRQKLRNSGEFFGHKYDLIYEGYDVQVYHLK